jgi:hypothetical protein
MAGSYHVDGKPVAILRPACTDTRKASIRIVCIECCPSCNTLDCNLIALASLLCTERNHEGEISESSRILILPLLLAGLSLDEELPVGCNPPANRM